MRRLEIGPGKERLPGFETLNRVKTPVTDHVGDARRPPFPDNTFDIVYSSHCIEHIEWYDVEQTIREWARIVKPGGHLEVFTVDALRLMKALVCLEDTGVWPGPAPGKWKSDLTKHDPYKWAVGRLMNYPKRTGAGWEHRALITPRYLRMCFGSVGLIEVTALTDEEARGKQHGWINFGVRGTKC